MNLAELYLLVSDLHLLSGLYLTDFVVKDKYSKCDPAQELLLFPRARIYGQTVPTYPKLIKVGRWGRNIILQFTTCTVVIKMAYRATVSVYRSKAAAESAEIGLCFLNAADAASKTYLFYKDPLSCGAVNVYASGDVPEEFGYLGIDVLDSAFNGEYLSSELFKEAHENPKKNLKSFLMDRGILAWMDNDIASEVLFVMGLYPMTTLAEFNQVDTAFLAKTIKTIYHRCIAHLRNDFQNTDRIPLKSLYSVYEREGQVCTVCDAKIGRLVIDGLVTYWCPRCQKIKQKAHA